MIKGLNFDTPNVETPDSSLKFAKNVIKKNGVFRNEKGVTLIQTLNLTPIGRVTTPIGEIIFSTDDIDSEIGVLNLKTGVYIAKVNNKDLAFDRQHPIKAVYEQNFKGDIIIGFTDYKNVPRVVNISSLATVFDITDFNAFPVLNSAKIFVGKSNGNLNSGAYYVLARYLDDDNTQTNYFVCSDAVIISPYENKNISITLTNIDTRYKFVQIAIVSRVKGVYRAIQLEKIAISSDIINTAYTGNESNKEVSLTSVLVPIPDYTKAHTVTKIKHRIAWGGMETSDIIDYQKYALDIVIKWVSKTVSLPSTERAFLDDEVYAFYIVLKLKTGGYSNAFHIPGRALDGGHLASSKYNVSGAGNANINLLAYEIEDTSTSEELGVWQNKNEFYPLLDSFVSANDVDFRGQNVRHHKFPKLSRNEYNANQTVMLGIKVENVVIPDEIKDKVVGYEIFYAKRDFANCTIVAQDLLTFAGNPEGTPTNIWTTGGNFSIDPQGDDTDGKVIELNKGYARFHAFDLLVNKPATLPTFMTLERKIFKAKLNVPVTSDVDGGAIVLTSDYRSYIIDYTKGIKFDNFPIPNEDYIRNLTEFEYVPANSVSTKYNNILAEECAVAKIEGAEIPLTPNAVEHDGNNDAFTYETAFIVNLHIQRDDMYKNFYAQNLVGTGRLITLDETDIQIYNGDCYYNAYAFLSFAGRNKEDVVAKDHGFRFIHNFYCQSVSNISAREITVENTKFYPQAKLGNTANDYPQSILRSEGNPIVYDRSYHSLQDIYTTIPINPYAETINKFPYRIVRSKISSLEDETNWKSYLANDYYEMPKARGKVMNLEAIDDVMLIHQERALSYTRDKTVVKTDNISLTLGAGDIFEFEPKEVNYTDAGTTGTKHRWSCSMTEYGYVWVNVDLGRVYLYGGGDKAIEISADRLRDFFKDTLILDEDNPFYGNGIITSFEEQNERIVVTLKKIILKAPYVFAGKYQDTDVFRATLIPNISVVIKDNKYKLWRGLIYGE